MVNYAFEVGKGPPSEPRPAGAQFIAYGSYFKKGLHGNIYRWWNGSWRTTTVTLEELTTIESFMKRSEKRKDLKRAIERKKIKGC